MRKYTAKRQLDGAAKADYKQIRTYLKTLEPPTTEELEVERQTQRDRLIRSDMNILSVWLRYLFIILNNRGLGKTDSEYIALKQNEISYIELSRGKNVFEMTDHIFVNDPIYIYKIYIFNKFNYIDISEGILIENVKDTHERENRIKEISVRREKIIEEVENNFL